MYKQYFHSVRVLQHQRDYYSHECLDVSITNEYSEEQD